MKALFVLTLLAACSQAPLLPPQEVSGLPPYCKAEAHLPKPPGADRSITQLVGYARTAATVANAAVKERDACALDYQRMRAACSAVTGCKITR